MCKIMLTAGIKKDKVENLWKFAKEIAPLLSKNNKDGFGYAAIDSTGKIFAERWLDNEGALKPNCGFSLGDIHLYKTLGEDTVKEKVNLGYSRWGLANKNDTVALMLHARWSSTGGKGIENTHPFIKNNTAIIHNGTIRNHEQLTKEMSTCDSEVILHEYLKSNVINQLEGIHDVTKEIKGGYAVGVLGRTEQGLPIMDVIKSNSPNLHCTYVDELETIVFSTDKDDLVDALKNLKWNINKVFTYVDARFIRLNALTGENLASLKLDVTEAFSDYPRTVYNPPVKKDPPTHSLVDRDFDEIVTEYQKDIDWIKKLEDEEVTRVAAANASYYGEN